MDYRSLFKEDNESVMERYTLSMERIAGIMKEDTVAEPYRSYFREVSRFVLMIGGLWDRIQSGEPDHAGLEELKEFNHRLYEDILPGNYEKSYANPAFAAARLGEEYGRLLSFLYSQIRGDIIFAYESRLTDITILNETLIEIYNLFAVSYTHLDVYKRQESHISIRHFMCTSTLPDSPRRLPSAAGFWREIRELWRAM